MVDDFLYVLTDLTRSFPALADPPFDTLVFQTFPSIPFSPRSSVLLRPKHAFIPSPTPIPSTASSSTLPPTALKLRETGLLSRILSLKPSSLLKVLALQAN